jgi:ATP-dependent protease HslVU (ClpYQ) peptidase subunit
MTIIAAVNSGGRTYIGSDSQITSGNLKLPYANKWLISPGRHLAIGHSGAARGMNVLMQHWDLLQKYDDVDEIAQHIRQALKDDGWTNDDKGTPCYEVSIIIATPDAVWHIFTDFTILRAPEGALVAHGSGSDFALGAAFAMQGKKPERVMQAALEAACAFDTYCGGPIRIERL